MSWAADLRGSVWGLWAGQCSSMLLTSFRASSQHRLSRVPPLSAEIKCNLRARGVLTNSTFKVHLTQGTNAPQTLSAEQNGSELPVASVCPERHLVARSVPESRFFDGNPAWTKSLIAPGPRTRPRPPMLVTSVKWPKFLPGCPGRCPG